MKCCLVIKKPEMLRITGSYVVLMNLQCLILAALLPVVASKIKTQGFAFSRVGPAPEQQPIKDDHKVILSQEFFECAKDQNACSQNVVGETKESQWQKISPHYGECYFNILIF